MEITDAVCCTFFNCVARPAAAAGRRKKKSESFRAKVVCVFNIKLPVDDDEKKLVVFNPVVVVVVSVEPMGRSLMRRIFLLLNARNNNGIIIMKKKTSKKNHVNPPIAFIMNLKHLLLLLFCFFISAQGKETRTKAEDTNPLLHTSAI